MEAAVTSKGQITIPKAIREHLHVQPGDRLKFFVHPDGTVVILPKLPITALRGLLRWEGPAATIEDMNEAIASGAVASGLPRKRR
jgi:antitoxin PrlF